MFGGGIFDSDTPGTFESNTGSAYIPRLLTIFFSQLDLPSAILSTSPDDLKLSMFS